MDKSDRNLTTVILCIFLFFFILLSIAITTVPVSAAPVEPAADTRSSGSTYYFVRGTFKFLTYDDISEDCSETSTSFYFRSSGNSYYVSKFAVFDGILQLFLPDIGEWRAASSLCAGTGSGVLDFDDDCPAVPYEFYSALLEQYCFVYACAREFNIYNFDGTQLYASVLAGGWAVETYDGAPALSFTADSLSIEGGVSGEWSYSLTMPFPYDDFVGFSWDEPSPSSLVYNEPNHYYGFICGDSTFESLDFYFCRQSEMARKITCNLYSNDGSTLLGSCYFAGDDIDFISYSLPNNSTVLFSAHNGSEFEISANQKVVGVDTVPNSDTPNDNVLVGVDGSSWGWEVDEQRDYVLNLYIVTADDLNFQEPDYSLNGNTLNIVPSMRLSAFVKIEAIRSGAVRATDWVSTDQYKEVSYSFDTLGLTRGYCYEIRCTAYTADLTAHSATSTFTYDDRAGVGYYNAKDSLSEWSAEQMEYDFFLDFTSSGQTFERMSVAYDVTAVGYFLYYDDTPVYGFGALNKRPGWVSKTYSQIYLNAPQDIDPYFYDWFYSGFQYLGSIATPVKVTSTVDIYDVDGFTLLKSFRFIFEGEASDIHVTVTENGCTLIAPGYSFAFEYSSSNFNGITFGGTVYSPGQAFTIPGGSGADCSVPLVATRLFSVTIYFDDKDGTRLYSFSSSSYPTPDITLIADGSSLSVSALYSGSDTPVVERFDCSYDVYHLLLTFEDDSYRWSFDEGSGSVHLLSSGHSDREVTVVCYPMTEEEYYSGLLGTLRYVRDAILYLPRNIVDLLIPDVVQNAISTVISSCGDFFSTAWDSFTSLFGLIDLFNDPNGPFGWLKG